MSEQVGELLPPTRLMLTPGPSSMDPRVYRARATPLVGRRDPWFMEMMGDVQVLLRRVSRTENRLNITHHLHEPGVQVAHQGCGQRAVDPRIHRRGTRGQHQPGRRKELSNLFAHGFEASIFCAASAVVPNAGNEPCLHRLTTGTLGAGS